jgi:hypothetical protein
MKTFKIFLFCWLFIFQQVLATQSLFLENRGAAVQHYSQYRAHTVTLSMTLNNNQSRLNGHPSRREARDLVAAIDREARGLSNSHHASAADLERFNNIRQHLSQLRTLAPDFVEGALGNPVNAQGVTDFSLESFDQETGDHGLERPAYCSNYPQLDREALRSFYGQAQSGDGFTCYELNGNGIGLDLSSMGEALISLEADAFRDQRRELQDSLILEAVSGILDESAAYAGLYPGTDNNLSSLRRCASNTAILNSGNDDLRTLVREHQNSLETRGAAFNRPFGSDENARRDALMRMQVRQALIIGNLYDLSRPESQPDHQSVSIGGGEQESFPAQIVTKCQEQMQQQHDFAFARHDPSGPSRFMVCREPEVLNRYNGDIHECAAALQEFLANEDHFSTQRECYYRESRRLEPVTADRLIPIMSASVDSHPLLFNRDDGRRLIPFLAADASYVPSDFARRVQSLPGASEISQAVEDILLTNPEDPHMAIEELLSRPEILPQLSRLIDLAVESQEMHESLKNEITEYQNELGQSAANVCESDGEHLHQFNSLVEDAMARELEDVTDPQERQRLLARRQAAQCWMLEDDPPEYEGGLPTGFMALGVGAIALGMVPVVGWAASAALMATGTGIAGANAYLQFDHARDRLHATTAAFQGGWTDSQHVLERVDLANSAESALWMEGLAVGILDLASPAAQALYRAANRNGEIAARINAFARDEAGSFPGPSLRTTTPSRAPSEILGDIDETIARGEGYRFITRVSDDEQPLIFNQNSRLHVREGHVFDFSSGRMVERLEAVGEEAYRRISNRMAKRFGNPSNRQDIIDEVAGIINGIENAPYRRGIENVTFFPESIRPSQVIAEIQEEGLTEIALNTQRGTREMRYRDSEGRVYAVFSCATERCHVPGVNGAASRQGELGEIASVFPLCGPGVRRVGRAHEMAEVILEARRLRSMDGINFDRFIERDVACSENIMTTSIENL